MSHTERRFVEKYNGWEIWREETRYASGDQVGFRLKPPASWPSASPPGSHLTVERARAAIDTLTAE